MDRSFHQENRRALYETLPAGSLLLLFSGHAPRKTGDEDYPFFADRSFVYYTGIEQADSVFAALKDEQGVHETLFMLPPDAHAERWTGARLKQPEAEAKSGVVDFRPNTEFAAWLDKLVYDGLTTIYLDFDRKKPDEMPVRRAFLLARELRERHPFLHLENVHNRIRRQRTIKKPCEIEAMRYAETITCAGIEAMMRAAHDGIWEYQLKAEFDYALAQRNVLSPGFPSIISAGSNNFCIHYYSYQGQAHDGDMVLNDVGACWDNEVNDVSRGWPLNGKFSERQKLLYECVYRTSNHMFETLGPGVPMHEVDDTIRRYNYEQLRDAGVCKSWDDIGTYMWHRGAHHVGYDVHDEVDVRNEQILTAPGMVFCIDIGVYHEEWGIGFRLEDNCLITENGCECLSSVTPRSVEDIEAFMGKR